jgi:predicted DNA binding CopG/RHH family protein
MRIHDKNFMVRISEKILNRVKRQSEKIGITMTGYIRIAVSEKLERDERKEK